MHSFSHTRGFSAMEACAVNGERHARACRTETAVNNGCDLSC